MVWIDCWRDWEAGSKCIKNQNLKILHMETTERIAVFNEQETN